MDLQPDLLIVGGGDGTICEAARRLAYADIALGLIPLGTTNNFARTLGIPLTLAGAIGILAGGKVADVDLGRAGDTVFANLVSAGLSAQVAASVPHRLKRVAGRAAYPLTALAALPRHRAFHAAITVGNQHYSGNPSAQHRQRQLPRRAADHRRRSADDRLLLATGSAAPAAASLITATLRHAALGARRTWAEPGVPGGQRAVAAHRPAAAARRRRRDPRSHPGADHAGTQRAAGHGRARTSPTPDTARQDHRQHETTCSALFFPQECADRRESASDAIGGRSKNRAGISGSAPWPAVAGRTSAAVPKCQVSADPATWLCLLPGRAGGCGTPSRGTP